jgi:hypothetical protein
MQPQPAVGIRQPAAADDEGRATSEESPSELRARS